MYISTAIAILRMEMYLFMKCHADFWGHRFLRLMAVILTEPTVFPKYS